MLGKDNEKAKFAWFHPLHEIVIVPKDNNKIVSTNFTKEMKSLALKLLQKV